MVADAIEPLAQLAGSLLDPARLSGAAGVRQLWSNSVAIANGVFGVLVMLGGLIVMTHETLQTRYAAKEIAPRLVMGFVAANLSWSIITTALEFAAALAVAIGGGGMSAGQVLTRLLVSSVAGGAGFLILLHVIVVVMAVALVLALIAIAALVLLLTISAPLALCLHALPQTEHIAWLWWRCLATTLAIPTLHALLLALIARILLTPGSFGVLGVPTVMSAANTLLNLLVVIVLLYLMIKMPRWMFRIATGRPARPGRRGGVVRSAVKSALVYAGLSAIGLGPAAAAAGAAGKTRRVLKPVLSHLFGNSPGSTSRARPPTKPRSASGPATSAGSRAAGPYSSVRATAGGQLMLPLSGVRRTRRRLEGRTPPPPTTSTPATASGGDAASGQRVYRGRQQSLFGRAELLGEPVAGRDGQYRLPIAVNRIAPAPAPAGRSTDPVVPAGRGGRQLSLWSRAQLQGQPVAGPGGQYQLPIPVTRVNPRAAAARPVSEPARTVRRGYQGRQQAFWSPAELRGEPHLDRGGQYRLRIPASHVPRPTPPPPATANKPPTSADRGQQLRLPAAVLARAPRGNPQPAKPTGRKPQRTPPEEKRRSGQ